MPVPVEIPRSPSGKKARTYAVPSILCCVGMSLRLPFLKPARLPRSPCYRTFSVAQRQAAWKRETAAQVHSQASRRPVGPRTTWLPPRSRTGNFLSPPPRPTTDLCNAHRRFLFGLLQPSFHAALAGIQSHWGKLRIGGLCFHRDLPGCLDALPLSRRSGLMQSGTMYTPAGKKVAMRYVFCSWQLSPFSSIGHMLLSDCSICPLDVIDAGTGETEIANALHLMCFCKRVLPGLRSGRSIAPRVSSALIKSVIPAFAGGMPLTVA